MKKWILARPRAATAGAALVLLLAILAWPTGGGERATTEALPQPTFDLALPTHETLDALARRYGERLDEQESAMGDLSTRVDELSARQQEAGEVQIEQMRAIQSAVEQTRRAIEGLRREPPPSPDYRPTPLLEVEIPGGASAGETLFLPAGTMIEGTLLTGAFAPLRGSPVPVEIELDRDGIAACGASVPVARAFVIARAQGDANSKRALLQLVRLVVVDREGRVYEREVDGFVSDSSGDLGVAGRLVDSIDRVAALAGAAGAIQGLGEAAARMETTTAVSPLGSVEQVTGDTLRYMAARGASGAAERVADVLTARLEMIEPQVHIPNGRRVVVHVLQGIDLGIPREDFHENDAPFDSVDARY